MYGVTAMAASRGGVLPARHTLAICGPFLTRLGCGIDEDSRVFLRVQLPGLVLALL